MNETIPNLRAKWLEEQLTMLAPIVQAAHEEVEAAPEDTAAAFKLKMFVSAQNDYQQELAGHDPVNRLDWVVAQRRMFDFDKVDRHNKAAAWVLLHQDHSVIEEFCSKEHGHDPRNMVVDIKVNGVTLPVQRFDDIVTNLAIAYCNHRFDEMGLSSLETSALTQAKTLVRESHNGLYNKLQEAATVLDTMSSQLEDVTKMMWNEATYHKLHSSGVFNVQLPARPEYRGMGKAGEAFTDRRKDALRLFCSMIVATRGFLDEGGVEWNKTELLARSIYADLDEDEVAIANQLLGVTA